MSRPLARRKFAMFTTHEAIFNEIVWSKTCIQSQLHHNRTLHIWPFICDLQISSAVSTLSDFDFGQKQVDLKLCFSATLDFAVKVSRPVLLCTLIKHRARAARRNFSIWNNILYGIVTFFEHAMSTNQF